MSKLTKRELLFYAHERDLREVLSKKDLFICPICGDEFSIDQLAQKLTIGHIWPKQFRKRNKALTKYQVILCKLCNNKSGSRGDAQMQLAEKDRFSEGIGVFKDRRIRLTSANNTIVLKANVIKTGIDKARLQFSSQRNNPSSILKFVKMAGEKQK